MKEQWIKSGKGGRRMRWSVPYHRAGSDRTSADVPIMRHKGVYVPISYNRFLILEGICCAVFLAAELVIAVKGREVWGMDFFSMIMCITASAIFKALFF